MYDMDWSTRHRIWYITGISVVLIAIALGIYFFFIYQKPTCSDRKKNGQEQGIDCGGVCTRICIDQNPKPIVQWSKAFKVSSGAYNLLAYIQNPDVHAGSRYAPYTFTVLDQNKKILFEKKGITFIPPGKAFGVFEGPISLGTGIPAEVMFTFDAAASVWDKQERNSAIEINRIRLTREKPTPRIDATLENTGLIPVGRIEAVGIVYDDSGNAFAVSRTFIDSLAPESAEDIVFTWPTPFTEQFARCEVPVDVVLAIDRSGSMARDGTNPPEPLTAVKTAAQYFVDALSSNSRTGLVSFATQARLEQPITAEHARITAAVNAVAIHSDGVQQTNIGDALRSASDSLVGSQSKKVIVLLTDGLPTEPTKTGNTKYPEVYALQQATVVKDRGIELHSIGLGSDVRGDFLQALASSSRGFAYTAPTVKELSDIYARIASSVCKKNPVIEVLFRVYP